jgi:hypothetical protein
MDTILAEPWTPERFLAWEDQQEGKHEFDGQRVVPTTGGTLGHQRIVRNLINALAALVDESVFPVVQEMRIRMGTRFRYTDVCVFQGEFDQATKTLTDAIAGFEVLSDDTATIDRVDKLIDYALLPSLRCYVLLEQTTIAATVFRREPGGPWLAEALTGGALALPGLDTSPDLAGLYRGLAFPATHAKPA